MTGTQKKSFRGTWGLDPSKSGRELAPCFLDEACQSVRESTEVCRSEAKPKIPKTQNTQNSTNVQGKGLEADWVTG